MTDSTPTTTTPATSSAPTQTSARKKRKTGVDIDEDTPTADMTSMIDIVFLLLVFFILTTTFNDEAYIRSLLDTASTGDGPSTVIEPPPTIRISVLPAGMPQHAQARELEQWISTYTNQRSNYAGGAHAHGTHAASAHNIVYSIAGKTLVQDTRSNKNERLEALHLFIAEHLQKFESSAMSTSTTAASTATATRADESPIEILCYSGLAWNDALSVYDAVRSYEHTQQGSDSTPQDSLIHARSVNFGSPNRRSSSLHPRGDELLRLAHTHAY